MSDDFWSHSTVSKLGSPLFGISVSPNSLGVECSGVFSRQGMGREDVSSSLRSACSFLSPTHLWGDLGLISGSHSLGCGDYYTPGGGSSQCGVRKASQAGEKIKNEHGESMSHTAHDTLRTAV